MANCTTERSQRGKLSSLGTDQEETPNDSGKHLHKCRLLGFQQLDIKGEGAVGRDARLASATICQLCGDDKSALASNRHASNTDIPALDDFTGTKLKAKRLAALICCNIELAFANRRGSYLLTVKNLSIGELANVSHRHSVTLLARGSLPKLLVINCDTANILDT